MSILPPISIPSEYFTASAIGFIPDGTWAGFPFRWQIDLTVFSQPHSVFETQTVFEYNGLDVKVGDWLGTSLGTAVQIVSINTANSTSFLLDCVVEDINLYNVNSDPTLSGTGLPLASPTVVFRIDDEGKAVINPAPTANLTPYNITDILSRFQYVASAPFKNWVTGNDDQNFVEAPVATSGNALAIGNAAQALAPNSISIGSSSEATGINSIAIGNDISVTENNALAFGSDGVIKLYLDEEGNTGIGTNNPVALLDLYVSSKSNYLHISNNLTGSDINSGVIVGLADNSSDLRIANLENAVLKLETAGFERITIDTSGFINFRHGGFNTVGDANYKFAVLKATTLVSGVETWLTLPDTDELDMKNNTTWLFEVDIVGKQQSGVISAGYRHKGLISRGNGAGTVAFVEQPFEELIGESVSAYGWESGVSADTSTGGLRIYGKVSGFSMPEPVSWLAMVKITEINF